MQDEITAEEAEQRGDALTIFPYEDETGIANYRVVRCDQANGKKKFVSESLTSDGTYKLGVKGVRRILYNLREVIEAESVLILEGEKCVEAVRRLGVST